MFDEHSIDYFNLEPFDGDYIMFDKHFNYLLSVLNLA